MIGRCLHLFGCALCGLLASLLVSWRSSGCVITVGSQVRRVLDPTLPRIVEKDGRYALMVDGAPFLVLGAQINNSSAWPAVDVEGLADDGVAPSKHCRSARSTGRYWSPSKASSTTLRSTCCLAQAREHHVRLVLLWFGTWKNGSGHYAPDWVKIDNAKYPRVVNQQGRKYGFSVSAFRVDIEGRQGRIRRVDAPLEGRRSATHRDHGAGRERSGNVGRRS